MLHQRIAVWCAAVLIVATACSGGPDRSDAGDAGGDPVHFEDPTEAVLAIAAALCQTGHACVDSYAGMFPFEILFGTSVQDCIANHVTSAAEAAAIGEDVAEGLTVFDAARADECYAWLQGTDCTTFWNEGRPTACSDMLSGTLPDGSDCTRDTQCVSDYCDYIDLYCRPE